MDIESLRMAIWAPNHGGHSDIESGHSGIEDEHSYIENGHSDIGCRGVSLDVENGHSDIELGGVIERLIAIESNLLWIRIKN